MSEFHQIFYDLNRQDAKAAKKKILVFWGSFGVGLCNNCKILVTQFKIFIGNNSRLHQKESIFPIL